MSLLEPLFFIILFLTAYPYFIYPLLVAFLATVAGKGWQQAEYEPKVSMVISLFNEEGVIAEKIENALMLQYPVGLLEIIIVSDGSTDNTNRIVSSYGDPRINFRAFDDRKGKTARLNGAVPGALGDIVVFTDANSMFPPDTIHKITRNFADEKIGLVTGWTKYVAPGGNDESTGLYSRMEKVTKYWESLVSSCVGADGAIFAIRKDLFLPLRDSDINDFVIPLNIIGQKRRAVLDPDLYCIEHPAEDETREFRRQVRITKRTLDAISRNVGFLNPFIYGSFSFFLLSHKIVRFMVPFFFAGVLVTALALSATSPVFAGFAVLQFLFVSIGLLAMVKGFGGRVGSLCAYFLLTIYAQLLGWIGWTTGKSYVMWKPER